MMIQNNHWLAVIPRYVTRLLISNLQYITVFELMPSFIFLHGTDRNKVVYIMFLAKEVLAQVNVVASQGPYI